MKICGNSSPKIFLDFGAIHMIPNMNLDTFRSSFRKNNGFYDNYVGIYCPNFVNHALLQKSSKYEYGTEIDFHAKSHDAKWWFKKS